MVRKHTRRFITVMVRPYARSPYGKIVLYTRTYSRHLTIASGVQGMIDLTVPGGGWSVSAVPVAGGRGEREERRELGTINRMLEKNGSLVRQKCKPFVWIAYL